MNPVRKNVLFITADQWRGDCLGVAGHPVVRTPNVDRLAADGVCFLRHYCQAAPCSPARAALYTGLYQMTNRVVVNGTPLDHRHDNIARALRRAGYDPTLFGYTDQSIDPRTTEGGDPRLRTFEGVLPGFNLRQGLPTDVAPWLSWLKRRGHQVPDDFWDIYRPRTGPSDPPSTTPPIYGADETETAFLTEMFLQWLDERRDGEPWFAHVSFLRPHPPFIVPEPYNTMYDPAEGPAFRRAPDADLERRQHPLLEYRLTRNRRDDGYCVGAGDGLVADWTDADFRTLRAIYWGMISEVDHQIGRIVTALRQTGAWKDTLIVLTSDHGEMMGDHHSLGKFGYFDQSYHIPLIIRDPDRPAAHGGKVDAFTESIDVMPTILESLDLPVPGHLDGRSLLPFLDGVPLACWRREVHWEYDFRTVDTGATENHFGISIDRCNLAVIRGDRYKYVHFGGLPSLLFNLDDDPDELRDLSGDPEFRDIRLDMAEKLLAWRADHLDRRHSGMVLTPDGPFSAR